MGQKSISEALKGNRIIPVIVIDEVEHALPLAAALAEGGITTMEITMRTKAAAEAIATIKKNLPEVSVGAGTVTSIEKLKIASDLGVDYLVSPGASTDLLGAFVKKGIPALPGTATISEAMTAYELGFTHLKFFPAEINGGAPALKSVASVLPEIKFCPTGGVSENNMGEYLSLGNVFAIGGSWLSPKEALKAKDWGKISALAADAIRKSKG